MSNILHTKAYYIIPSLGLALDVDTVEEVLYSRVRKDYTPLHVYLGCVWVVIYVKYITYEGLLHNILALDVDTVQEACIQQTRV